MDITPISAEDWFHTMSSMSYFLYQIQKIWTVGLHGHPVQQGERARNINILKIEDFSKYRLLDFQKLARPLVVNFGSCS